MKRSFLASAAGLLTWLIVAIAINRLLRLTLPGYTAAELTASFTLSMKWARLLMAVATSLTAGAVARWISPMERWAPWIVGGIVLAISLPRHIFIWSRYPVWYHLTYLLTIVPSVLAGSRLVRRPQ